MCLKYCPVGKYGSNSTQNCETCNSKCLLRQIFDADSLWLRSKENHENKANDIKNNIENIAEVNLPSVSSSEGLELGNKTARLKKRKMYLLSDNLIRKIDTRSSAEVSVQTDIASNTIADIDLDTIENWECVSCGKVFSSEIVRF